MPSDRPGPIASDAELVDALRDILEGHVGEPVSIVRLEHRPSAYRTSFSLYELDVTLDAGPTFLLILKDLGSQNLHPTARRARPEFLIDPLREIMTYREILHPCEMSTARFYGAVVDRARGRYWLVLERVAGRELAQVGEFSAWREAARWLATMHQRFAHRVGLLGQVVPLLKLDLDYFRLWLDRARTFRASDLRPAAWERLARCYDRAVERLASLPTTLLHGEFYASNVLMQETPAGWRVCPVDWETAAEGPALIDLAALTAGDWSARERMELVAAYHATLVALGASPPDFAMLLASHDDCRLHLAVRWLGWSPDWIPPARHAHDWLAEACTLAETIGDH